MVTVLTMKTGDLFRFQSSPTHHYRLSNKRKKKLQKIFYKVLGGCSSAYLMSSSPHSPHIGQMPELCLGIQSPPHLSLLIFLSKDSHHIFPTSHPHRNAGHISETPVKRGFCSSDGCGLQTQRLGGGVIYILD